MEHSGKKKEGYYVFIILIALIASFYVGKSTGIYEVKSNYLESAYIESCDDYGDYCLVETNYGQKTISCNEYDNCLNQEKVEGEQEAEMKKMFDELFPFSEDIDNSKPSKESWWSRINPFD